MNERGMTVVADKPGMTGKPGVRVGSGLAWALAAGVGVMACVQARGELVFGVTLEQTLVSFDSAAPTTLLSGMALQGLQPNETIRGIDFRPATGQLYALGSFGRLYRVNPSTAVATQVGSPLSPGLNGSAFGFDFNPTVDRIRVVSDADQNLRLNPDTASITVDTPLSYVNSDPRFGMNPNAVHAAYTNSFAGSTSTTLYVLDTLYDTLVIQNPANSGNLLTVGSVGADLTDLGGFDISGATNVAYATVRDVNLSRSTFWTINLATGAGSMVGEIGGGAILTAMAVVPAPGSIAVLGLAGLALRRRR